MLATACCLVVRVRLRVRVRIRFSVWLVVQVYKLLSFCCHRTAMSQQLLRFDCRVYMLTAELRRSQLSDVDRSRPVQGLRLRKVGR